MLNSTAAVRIASDCMECYIGYVEPGNLQFLDRHVDRAGAVLRRVVTRVDIQAEVFNDTLPIFIPAGPNDDLDEMLNSAIVTVN